MAYNFINLSTLFTAWTTSQGKNVLLSQFDKSIFCAMGKCSEITAHVLRRNCWVNSVHFEECQPWIGLKWIDLDVLCEIFVKWNWIVKKKIHYVCKGESEEETSKMKRNGDSQRACWFVCICSSIFGNTHLHTHLQKNPNMQFMSILCVAKYVCTKCTWLDKQ